MHRALAVCSLGLPLLLAAQSDWTSLMERARSYERAVNYRQAALSYLDALQAARGREVVASLNSLGGRRRRKRC